MNFTGKLQDSRRYRVVLWAMLLAAGVSSLRLAFHLGYTHQLLGCTALAHPHCYVNMEGSYFVGITATLWLSAVGLKSRRILGLIFSMLALAGTSAVYVQWYRGTLSTMQMYNAKFFHELPDQQQHLLTLNNASRWDVVVLGVVLIVFVWHLVELKRNMKPLATFSKDHRLPKSA